MDEHGSRKRKACGAANAGLQQALANAHEAVVIAERAVRECSADAPAKVADMQRALEAVRNLSDG